MNYTNYTMSKKKCQLKISIKQLVNRKSPKFWVQNKGNAMFEF